MNPNFQKVSPPPLLLAGALLFWAWQTGLWWFAIGMGLALEAHWLIKGRWDFTETELNRLWDACTVIFVGAAVYAYSAGERGTITFMFFQWLPILFFLMPLAEGFSVKGMIPLRTFSWFLRKSTPPGGIKPENSISVGYIYLALILIASSAANRRDAWFFTGTAVLCCAACFWERPKRFALWKWAVVFGLAVVLGNRLQVGIHQLHAYVESQTVGLWFRLWKKDFDPIESQTTIGSVGRKKQSGRIVLRLKPVQGSVPGLLRATTYDSLGRTTWYAQNKKFDTVSPETDLTTWNFGPEKTNVFTLSMFTTRGRGVLPAGLGASGVARLPVGSVETNLYGAVRMQEAPGMLNCQIRFDHGSSIDGAPTKEDLALSDADKRYIKTVADEIGLLKAPAQDRLRLVEKFFADNFTYSLNQEKLVAAENNGTSPVEAFLTQVRSGHCEYFATATVLLLRYGGIPARYATGFAVDERDDSGTYLVRERHAHAWTIAHLNGRWSEVDTTSGNWLDQEKDMASAFEPVRDFFSKLWFKFSEWRWNREKGTVSRFLPWVLVVMLLAIIGRTFLTKKKSKSDAGGRTKRIGHGTDSPFFELVHWFEAKGRLRESHETFTTWSKRLKEHESLPENFEAALKLHYRYRFDPKGIPAPELAILRSHVKTSLVAAGQFLSQKKTG